MFTVSYQLITIQTEKLFTNWQNNKSGT